MTPKEIRKQIKNVSQAMLKEATIEEMVLEVERRVLPVVKARLDAIDSRMKDIQGYFVRQSASRFVPPTEDTEETTNK